MAQLPDDYAVAGGFVAARSAEAWALVSDIADWPAVFPDWIATVEQDDDRFTVTAPDGAKFDLYPHPDAEQRALDVEVVDELGSADVLRLRVLDMPGGSLVIVAHGRLSGTADAAWHAKRDAVDAGLKALAPN